MSLRNFYALVFVLVIIAFVASLVVLLVVKSPNKWKYWGLGFGIYVVLSVAILNPIYSSIQANEYEKRDFLRQMADDNTKPECATERDVCMKRALDLKRANDINIRGDMASLEAALLQDPANEEVRAKVQHMRETFARDSKQIDDCKHKSANNACTKDLLDTCAHMVLSNHSAEVHTEFRKFRKEHETKNPKDVLQMCKVLAQ